MSLDYWKLGGGQASYNVLPLGWGPKINPKEFWLKDVLLTFTAKSASGGQFRVTDTGYLSLDKRVTLTPELKEYQIEWYQKQSAELLFYTYTNDVVITDIQIVQKPLPKLTINGIDGFTSGKWTLHANAKVVDDETLELAATADWQYNDLIVNVVPSQTHVIDVQNVNGARIYVYDYTTGIGSILAYQTGVSSVRFTFVPQNNKVAIRFSSSGVGTYTFKRPMLNLGTTPAPYEKKKGEKMVLPVPKGNLLPSLDVWTESNPTKKYTSINVTANKDYSLSLFGFTKVDIEYRDSSGNYISTPHQNVTAGKSFKLDGNVGQLKIFAESNNFKNAWIQLNEGTTPQPYTPYAVQVNKKPKRLIDGKLPKAKSGLTFNGVSDYLQLPSMTMDSVEIECLIDSVQASSGYLLDARTGSTGFVTVTTNGNTYVEAPFIMTGFKRGERTKIKVSSPTPFTDDVTIFARNTTFIDKLKGALYKVTCYLGNQVVAQYDFENSANIVGDKIIPNAKNLIPSFEDARWVIHANADVMGKDVLRLEATMLQQWSDVEIDGKPNTDYLLVINNLQNNAKVDIQENGIYKRTLRNGNVLSFKTALDTNKLKVRLGNDTVGTFDFIKPQLYELTGKEGSLVGRPTPLRKAAKRTLYRKR